MKQKLFSVFVLSALLAAQVCAMPLLDSELAAHEEQEKYGDIVINERMGVTRFIGDIITGCFHKWDEQEFLELIQGHIANGVRINKSCLEKRTPLMYACWFEAPLCVIQALVDAGGSVRRCRDRKGRTALRYACQPRQPSYDVIKLLLDNGARVDVKDDDGAIPFDYVWRNSQADKRVKDLLLEHYRYELERADLARRIQAAREEERRQLSDELPKLLEEKECDAPVILIRRIG